MLQLCFDVSLVETYMKASVPKAIANGSFIIIIFIRFFYYFFNGYSGEETAGEKYMS